MKDTIAVFDFDGTLTKKDSFIEFIKFTFGMKALLFGLLQYSPLLLLMKLGLYDNGRAKQKVFAHFFKGKDRLWFEEQGRLFANEVEKMLRTDIMAKLDNHLSHGDTVYVVTASIEEWVRPWCESHHIDNVIATKAEINGNGIITGKFLTKNCYGPEKVSRLLKMEPNRSDHYLYAYGDSRGDREMFQFADERFFV